MPEAKASTGGVVVSWDFPCIPRSIGTVCGTWWFEVRRNVVVVNRGDRVYTFGYLGR